MLQTTTESRGEAVSPFPLSLPLCRSNGGPHDDEAFLSGWRLGDIDATLAQSGIDAYATAIHPLELDQAGQIATARGYAMTVEPSADADWVLVTLRLLPHTGVY